MGRGRGRRSSRVESWLQGIAITHQRPGQPASLCALRNPPVPGRRPQPRRSGLEAEFGSCVGAGPRRASWRKGCGAGQQGAQRQQVKRFGLRGTGAAEIRGEAGKG